MRFQDQSLRDVQVWSLRQDGATHQVSPHFRLIEYACRDGSDIVLLHPRLVDLVELIREKAGVIHVNSGYRTPSHNDRIDGAPHSYHVLGFAADLSSRRLTTRQLFEIANQFNPGGCKEYNTFVHVDVGPKRTW